MAGNGTPPQFCLPPTTVTSTATVQPHDLRFHCDEESVYAHRAVLTQFGCAWVARLIEMDGRPARSTAAKRQKTAVASPVTVEVAEEDWPAFRHLVQAHYGPVALEPEQLADLAVLVAKVEHRAGQTALRRTVQRLAGTGPTLAALAARLLPQWAAARTTFFLADELRPCLRNASPAILERLPATLRHVFGTLCLQDMLRHLPDKTEAERLWLELLQPHQLIALRHVQSNEPLYRLLDCHRVTAALEMTALAGHTMAFSQDFPCESPRGKCWTLVQGTSVRLYSSDGVGLSIEFADPHLRLLPLHVTLKLRPGGVQRSFTQAIAPNKTRLSYSAFFTGPGPCTVDCCVTFVPPTWDALAWPQP